MKNQPLIKQAMSILKEHGYKYTKKEAIITYLVKRNRYLPAKEIHDFMSEEYPGLSYDTIYRNLHDFSEIGILEETELNGEMKFRYNCCVELEDHHHHHFICTVCGKTKSCIFVQWISFKNNCPGAVSKAIVLKF